MGTLSLESNANRKCVSRGDGTSKARVSFYAVSYAFGERISSRNVANARKRNTGFERFDTTETGIWTVEVVRRRSIHYAKSAIKEGMKYASRAPVSYHQVEENLPFPCETNGEKPLHRA